MLAATMIAVSQLTNPGSSAPLWTGLIVLGLCGTVLVSYWDGVRRTTVLLYDLDINATQRYQLLHDAFDQLAACDRTWHLRGTGTTKDSKRGSGDTTLVVRKEIRLDKKAPSTLRTNVEVPNLLAGRHTLCFLPDRLVVFDREGVGAVEYEQLTIDFRSTRSIERDPIPRDAIVVEQTWRHMNEEGGPDTRFKDNRQLSVCLYQEINSTSPNGLSEAIQVSRPDVGERLRDALRAQVTAHSGQGHVEMRVKT